MNKPKLKHKEKVKLLDHIVTMVSHHDYFLNTFMK